MRLFAVTIAVASRRRKMRHGNCRGDKNKEVREGQNLPFSFKENKRIKPIKHSNKCVDVYA